MSVLLSDNSRRLRSIDGIEVELGGGGFNGGGFDFGSGGGQFFALPIAPMSSPSPAQPGPSAPVGNPLDFDFDLSQIGLAVRRGNTEADVRSAYELFSTGSTRGRALEYAQSDVQRFGYPSLRHAAAAYLDAAGLPRLAQIVSPDPTPVGDGDFFGLPVPPDPVAGGGAQAQARSPFEILADVLPNLFGQAVYNPPLQSQAYGYTPADVSAQGGGGLGSLGGWLILAGLAIAAYFIYKRVSA